MVWETWRRERGTKTNGKKKGKNSSLPSVKLVQRKKMVHGNIKTTSFPSPPPSSSIHLIIKMTSFSTKQVISFK